MKVDVPGKRLYGVENGDAIVDAAGDVEQERREVWWRKRVRYSWKLRWG